MPTFDLLAAPPDFWPAAVLRANLLDFVIVYVTLAFVASFLLRVRMYWAVYRIAKYFADSCPNVFELLRRHLSALLQNGLAPLLAGYATVFAAYLLVTRVALPRATLSLADLAAFPGTLAFCAALLGATLAVDLAMTLQVGKIDVAWVQAQLEYAERWLGGRINRALDVLGRWNPLRRYADGQTRQALAQFNALFRHNLALTIFQTAVRLALVGTLFAAAARLHWR